ncbi:hypothetical protein HMPREF9209_1993 [Lactobacillus gasseri 224-1]|uniref:Uncharacterized protein n=1 Tax=Lactobacillus gasseri 224-1 TaxID=679196 RepID=D1YLF1_LACGS|nr:hypothetical protein HMPREF9209_1993 [Lactobacillus gasseri 224-1]
MKVEVPNAEPIVYTFDSDLHIIKKKFCTKRVDFWSAPFLIVCIGIFMVKFFTSIFEQILVE